LKTNVMKKKKNIYIKKGIALGRDEKERNVTKKR